MDTNEGEKFALTREGKIVADGIQYPDGTFKLEYHD